MHPLNIETWLAYFKHRLCHWLQIREIGNITSRVSSAGPIIVAGSCFHMTANLIVLMRFRLEKLGPLILICYLSYGA